MSRKERRESTNSDGSSDSDSSSNAEEETKPSNDIVLNKYTSAGEIANTVLKVGLYDSFSGCKYTLGTYR
jgi:hypothetical protein